MTEFLQRVINGDIEVTGLRNAVKQNTGGQRLKQEVMEFINATTATQQDHVQKKGSYQPLGRRGQRVPQTG